MASGMKTICAILLQFSVQPSIPVVSVGKSRMLSSGTRANVANETPCRKATAVKAKMTLIRSGGGDTMLRLVVLWRVKLKAGWISSSPTWPILAGVAGDAPSLLNSRPFR